jgi:Phage portal protein
MGLVSSLRHAWNAFKDWDQNYQMVQSYAGGSTFGVRPDRTRLNFSNERSIISSILTRMSLDAASIQFTHVRNDADGRYQGDIQSGLNNCFTVQANIDQFAQQFRQDIFMTMFDKGVVAIVPIDTTINPIDSNAYDVLTMRCGEVVAWYPEHVRVMLYNEQKGYRQQITLPKSMVAIVENPLYQVMNEPSSTLQRLIRKLNQLDQIDEQSSSGKLDLIIQLPYVIKSEARRAQAEQRRKDIEFQLKGSQYGIAYADGTEKITQLNRPATNNLMDQITYLTQMLYDQLGLTDTIMNGSATESTMNNYLVRTIEPIVTAVVEAMKATFLTKTARTQGQSITFFRNPFSLVPMADFAKIADMLSRNEIASANDLRTAIGWKPSKDPKADKLINSNMPTPAPLDPAPRPPGPVSDRRVIPGSVPRPELTPVRPALHPQLQRQLTGTGGNSQNGT